MSNEAYESSAARRASRETSGVAVGFVIWALVAHGGQLREPL